MLVLMYCLNLSLLFLQFQSVISVSKTLHWTDKLLQLLINYSLNQKHFNVNKKYTIHKCIDWIYHLKEKVQVWDTRGRPKPDIVLTEFRFVCFVCLLYIFWSELCLSLSLPLTLRDALCVCRIPLREKSGYTQQGQTISNAQVG